MYNEELDKMINNVIASFRIDNIEVPMDFVYGVKERVMHKNKNVKCLIKKEIRNKND